ncbi:hypothetical protein PTKIN_Ptkin12aG0023900 [Pterospermum kingtungense]
MDDLLKSYSGCVRVRTKHAGRTHYSDERFWWPTGPGIRKSDLSVVNEKQARIHNPAALPEEVDRQFSLAEIIVATGNFHEVIDSGGCGRVYKGFFYDGNLVVAVKCLNPNSHQAFTRGLHYLHSGAKQGVIHRDTKSSNILLDDNWVCKLCHFGLSKLHSRSKSKSLQRIDTIVLGSPGYLDPEYYIQSQLSEKSDVYSFGVVLFEVLCARKAFDTKLDGDSVSLVSLCHHSIVEGTIYNIIDPYLKGRIGPESLEIFVDIAYSCTHREGNTRPDMGEVEVMLELALELQEETDSDMFHLASNGESIYEEVLSCAFVLEYSSTGNSCSVECDTEITYSAPDCSSFTVN